MFGQPVVHNTSPIDVINRADFLISFIMADLFLAFFVKVVLVLVRVKIVDT